jgi:hypothetical protein
MSSSQQEPFDWREERLRYQVLRFVYDTVGPECEAIVNGAQIGTALALGFDELLRVVLWLDGHGYVHQLSGGSRLCLTPKGVAYLEESGGRRRSLRN